MSSIDHEELFEQYYQNVYDFNTNTLSPEDVAEIKKLSREKRVDYNLAPMGTSIFNWITKENNNIRFELVPFNSEKIDGMLYIPTTGKERAYIILNSNKPLINQVFAAAHEYYHYISDYKKIKEMPYICDFSMLKDINEMKASRFAAELLLPEEALSREVQDFCRVNKKNINEMKFTDYASIFILLTIKYEMPLKAVIYRFKEEKYVDNLDEFIKNYDFIKSILKEITIFKNVVTKLYGTENDYVIPYSSTYQDMEKAFESGNASKDSIIKDAMKLNLNMEIVNEILDYAEEDDDTDDEEELFFIINKERR